MNYLGIDTSVYTTSLAIVDESGLIWEARRVLDVAQGETGLAQSAAFFQHVRNLPLLVREVPPALWKELGGVGVSLKPRPQEGSYMPVFTAGYAVAAAIASARGLALFETTHQEGHTAAGLYSSGLSKELSNKILAVHLSGGTTELLLVEREKPGSLKIEILGGTTDLHAGQFVDRVGVLLGLPFPAGPALEKLARHAGPGAETMLPSSVQGFQVSFSGVETAARRLLEQGTAPEDVARAVEGCVARTISKLILTGMEHTGLGQVLVVGGVAANRFVRAEIERRLSKYAKLRSHRNRPRLYWAEPNWSRDNAIGVAFLTRERVKSFFSFSSF
ncbi:tRNA (adenosine(37)-N6)-threonylcarbamoyltransferase complex transferase subunit TsaD [Paradesulfitobacterium ferrireducens]|uniref:O-sialoglycoprotein endopeptidase n=1 Tax=Paradesulfitobacterium ferrireducens TaxID=2816476 RepID=UPI001A8ED893|nr:O-sialoglycoprotein endopeptidase [Paradesulfitobacterium ferrireducens]